MDFGRLKSFLDSLARLGVPGVDCSVSVRGRTVFRHGAGFSDLENRVAVNGGELYNIYSLTKLVTCVGALRLFERGAFLMGDPLGEYLHEFRAARVFAGGVCSPAARPIRVGHLFTMTAGLSYDMSSPSIAALRQQNPNCTTREFAAAIAREPLGFEPGERWRYSLCHDVLGALIEAVSGKSLGTYLDDEIFAPLGMRDTAFRVSGENKSRLARQYVRDAATGAPIPVSGDNVFVFGDSVECGGAGLVSGVDDYMLFAGALACGGTAQNGYRLLSPSTVSLMRENHLKPEQTAELRKMTGRGFGYGLGAAVLVDRAAAGTPAPNGQFGWGGAAGAQAFADTENGVALVYMQHLLGGREGYIAPRLRNILYSCL